MGYGIEDVEAERDAALAEIDRLRERLAEAEDYAAEGWAWLDDALDAGGWSTVFDIPRRVGGEAHAQAHH